jgi:2-amino-4-hydroxy-6-hydroxymethyldihydropteridine diphosphokinase
LGSNKALYRMSSEEIVQAAAKALGALGAEIVRSPLYRSPAWPDPKDPPYVNAAASFQTVLSPEALLAGLQAIEAGFGRLRSADPALRYGPRTLDLDLLAVGEGVRASAELTLPHPRIAERDFVLLPLRDIAPGWQHPLSGETAEEMLGALAEVTARKL